MGPHVSFVDESEDGPDGDDDDKKILSEWHNKSSVILHEVELLPAGWRLGPSYGKWEAF